MSHKSNIDEKLRIVRGELLKKGATPSVTVGVGVDPLKDKYFSRIIVVSSLPDKEKIIACLEDAIKMVKAMP